MKIVHRVSLSSKLNRKPLKRLRKLGIELSRPISTMIPLQVFEISEDDARWPEISKILTSGRNVPILTRSEFTGEEILSAEWVKVFTAHVWGYPMPNLYDEYKEISYTSENECKDCGIGLCQKAPIHLKSEPKLGRNHFMGIFWTYDIFARNEVFEVLSQNGITGFEACPAIHYKKKAPLKTIKQLKVLGELGPAVINDNLTREDYSCRHVKYLGLSRGMYRFPRDAFKDMPDLVKSHEWFGSGHGAGQLVLASARFAHLYMKNNWRGLSLAPLELI